MEYIGGIVGGKKAILICILKILRYHSDSHHPMTISMIIEKLKSDFGIEAARNAVGRNISQLRELGYKIGNNGKGFYLSQREFSDLELKILIDSVLTSRYIPSSNAKILIDKLAEQSNRYFRGRLRNINSLADWPHQRNDKFFDNLEKIDQAITKRKQLKFIYNYMSTDGKLHPKTGRTVVVNPFSIVCTKGQYYLVCSHAQYDNLMHYRIDRMTNVEFSKETARKVESIPAYKNGLAVASYANEHIFMYGGEAVTVTMKMPVDCAGGVLDSFGDKALMRLIDDKYMKVRVTAAIEGVRFFALQYGANCEVMSPDKLREMIKEDIRKMAEMYY